MSNHTDTIPFLCYSIESDYWSYHLNSIQKIRRKYTIVIDFNLAVIPFLQHHSIVPRIDHWFTINYTSLHWSTRTQDHLFDPIWQVHLFEWYTYLSEIGSSVDYMQNTLFSKWVSISHNLNISTFSLFLETPETQILSFETWKVKEW